jgi:O-methyltransferase
MSELQGKSAPEQSYQWLRPLIPKQWQPWLRGIRKKWQLNSLQLEEPYKTVFTYTQASSWKQQNLIRLGQLIDEQNIEGAIVECGVLDGGTAALMAFATKKSSRPIHLFDAWQGLPESSEEDGEAAKKWVGQVVGSPKRVQEIMSKLSISADRIHIHKGWFHETFPEVVIEEVALLHVDCDFYDPTVLCLEKWWPHIIKGGYIQFDDYLEFQGCTKSVNEFMESHPNIKLETFGKPGQGQAWFIQKQE